MITPREVLRDYMTVLNILMQNPDANFDDVVGAHVTLKTEKNDDDELEVLPTAKPDTASEKKFTANDIEF